VAFEATLALRGRSFSIRRTHSVPSIRGGADGPEADARADADLPLQELRPVGLPETAYHQCPTCGSRDVRFMNTARAGGGVIKLKYSCQECHQQFWLVSADRPAL